MRIFEKPLLEALFLTAGGRAHYPGEKPYASVEDDHRSELSAREHIVTDGDLFHRPSFEDSLVESFEPPTEQDDPPTRRELTHAPMRTAWFRALRAHSHLVQHLLCGRSATNHF